MTDPGGDENVTWQPRRGPLGRFIAWALLAIILAGFIAALAQLFPR